MRKPYVAGPRIRCSEGQQLLTDRLPLPLRNPRKHEQLHAGHFQVSREDLLEIIITNVICYLDENKALFHLQNVAGGAGAGTEQR